MNLVNKGSWKMKKSRYMILSCIVSLLLIGIVNAETAGIRLGVLGDLVVDVPDRWDAKREVGENSVVLKISPGEDVPLLLQISVIPMNRESDILAAARETAEIILDQYGENAEEKEIPILEISGQQGQEGYYISVTDRTVENPSRDEYKYADVGAMAVGRMQVTFTLLTNIKDGPVRAQALDIVRSALHILPGPPWRTPEGDIEVTSHNFPSILQLSLPGYELGPAEYFRGYEGIRIYGENPETHMIVSIFLEPSPEGWTVLDHRVDVWKKAKKTQEKAGWSPVDVVRYERGGMAVLQYDVPEVRGVPVKQRSVNAFLVKDGFYVDVHLSKAEYSSKDEALFSAVLNSIRFKD